MARVAREWGFRVTAQRRMSVPRLERYTAAGVPVICLIQTALGGGHYVVVVGVGDDTVTYADPWDGETVTVSRRTFLSRWWDAGEDGSTFRRYGLALRPRDQMR